MSMFKENIQIREVWADNLEEELLKIQGILQHFPYVGLDTDFCSESDEKFKKQSSSDRSYPQFVHDMNQININQMGITFFERKGDLPSSGRKYSCLWEFQFRDEIKQNNENKRMGIDALTFGKELKNYKIVSNKNLSWVSFGGRFDFGVLLKMLTGQNLPEIEEEFNEKLKEFFPVIYNLKHVYMNKNKALERLDIAKFSFGRLATTESLLTSRMFVKLLQKNKINLERKAGAGVSFGVPRN